MDKQLLKAYIRTIVEEEVKRVLPELLAEAVQEVKQLTETKVTTATKPSMDRSKLAAMMGLSYDGNTLQATSTDRIASRVPADVPAEVDPTVVAAINKDYSALMKKMGLSK